MKKSDATQDERWRVFLDHLDGKQLTDASEPKYISGSRPLRAGDISFAEDIIQNENLLEFYMEVSFDADAVFGTHVCTDENDDWLNIYANYDLEHGCVCDTLQIYPDAVSMLLGQIPRAAPAPAKQEASAPKPFALPEASSSMRRMYAYLMRQRHISREVITEFVRAKLLYEDIHHNCVFVGLDASGAAKHAHLRSTNSEGRAFRMNVEGSESAHSFHRDGTDKSLYVFEAPIDLMSHMTLYPYGWLEHSYVACCGTSIQPVLERLRQNPKLDMVYLCLDNDEAGEEACDRMTDALQALDVDVERLCPEHKDWNEDLCTKSTKRKKEDAP